MTYSEGTAVVVTNSYENIKYVTFNIKTEKYNKLCAKSLANDNDDEIER